MGMEETQRHGQSWSKERPMAGCHGEGAELSAQAQPPRGADGASMWEQVPCLVPQGYENSLLLLRQYRMPYPTIPNTIPPHSMPLSFPKNTKACSNTHPASPANSGLQLPLTSEPLAVCAHQEPSLGCLGPWGTCVRSKLSREHGELGEVLWLCCDPPGKIQGLLEDRLCSGEG